MAWISKKLISFLSNRPKYDKELPDYGITPNYNPIGCHISEREVQNGF
jgi:hypothetical protein